jgi:ribulose 1,5-bisphosphate synthetase/thiazole synthase
MSLSHSSFSTPTAHHTLPIQQRLEDDSLPYDAVIIGAGLAGVTLLAEAVKHGYKRVIVLERKPYIGGLWVDLPAWQTLQNDPADFCLNGFTTRRKVWTALDVCHMMEEYVRVAGLAVSPGPTPVVLKTAMAPVPAEGST